MAFCVFVRRPNAAYDDRRDEKYQFDAAYLDRAKKCVGDWIIYCESRGVAAARVYSAVAKVETIIPDPLAEGKYIALMEAGSYADFPNPVPLRHGDASDGRGGLSIEGRISARTQPTVRSIPQGDFNRIFDLGLGGETTRNGDRGFGEAQAPFELEARPRCRAETLQSRIIRDTAFRGVILRAYDSRCAISGVRLIDTKDSAEVHAAHIRSVDADGPDMVNNGLALSQTMHWAFDHGLISVTDDMKILISTHKDTIENVRGLIRPGGRLLIAERPMDRPDPRFLRWHRENCFKP